MSGNRNFDKELRLKQGAEQYRLNKSKAGRSGSSAVGSRRGITAAAAAGQQRHEHDDAHDESDDFGPFHWFSFHAFTIRFWSFRFFL